MLRDPLHVAVFSRDIAIRLKLVPLYPPLGVGRRIHQEVAQSAASLAQVLVPQSSAVLGVVDPLLIIDAALGGYLRIGLGREGVFLVSHCPLVLLDVQL